MKRKRPTTRGGRKRMRPEEYRRMLKAQAQSKGEDAKTSMEKHLFFGSKCHKTAQERRPHKGGRVHPQGG